MKKLLFLILFFLIALPVLAHQPRIVSENFIEIKNPEVSQAFYGKMKGEPAYYQIKSEEPFNLYVGLLVPDLEGVDRDVSAEVKKDENFLFLLDGLNHEWERYFEEHGGDYYYTGPEKEAGLVEAGIYNIKVFSPDNEGKYTLVVGEKESFPLPEIINTLKILPKLKSDFFGKSPFTAFFNLVGLYLLVFFIIVAGVVVLLVWVIKRLVNK